MEFGWQLLSGVLLVLVGWEHVIPKRSSEYYGWLLLMLSVLIYNARGARSGPRCSWVWTGQFAHHRSAGITRSDDSGREAALKYFTLPPLHRASSCWAVRICMGPRQHYDRSYSAEDRPTTHTILRSGFGVNADWIVFPRNRRTLPFLCTSVFSGATLPMAAAMSFIPS